MKKKIVIGTVILAIIAVFVFLNLSKGDKAVTAFGSGTTFEVNTVKVTKGDIASTISANGVTEQTKKFDVNFETPMKVLKINVKVNEKVNKGQKLFEVDMDNLNSEYTQLMTNKAIQELAIMKLKNTKDENINTEEAVKNAENNVKSAENDVKSAENNVKSVENNVKSAENNVEEAENNVKNAESSNLENKKLYESNQMLFDAGALSQMELDKSKKAYEDSGIALDDAKIAQHNAGIAQHNAGIALHNAEITLDNARITLENAKTAYVSALKDKSNKETVHDNSVLNKDIELKTQEENLKATLIKISDIKKKINKINDTLVSPMDGIVSEINAAEGTYTSAVMPVIKIVGLGELRVKAKVSEYNIKNVKIGQPVEITGDAIDKNIKIRGRVGSISPNTVLNQTSNGQETVVEVIINLDKSDYELKSGLNVTCEIETNKKKDVLVTGLEIFDEDKDSNKFAYVVDESKNIMKKKQVTLGITSDMNTEILSGLNEGDLVILYPKPVYKDGAKIKILKDNKK